MQHGGYADSGYSITTHTTENVKETMTKTTRMVARQDTNDNPMTSSLTTESEQERQAQRERGAKEAERVAAASKGT